MATTELIAEPHDAHGPGHGHGHAHGSQRRRPFSTWVRRLTNFKSSEGDRHKRHRRKKHGSKPNNPYPESGHVGNHYTTDEDDPSGDAGEIGDNSLSFTTGQTGSRTSLDQSPRRSSTELDSLEAPPDIGTTPSTAGTDHEGARSIIAPSHGASSLAGTSRTIGGGVDSSRRGDSTFSSPAPSVRSLTTTLTTIQSMAPPGAPTPPAAQPNLQSIQFSQPFPTASPASAIPAHLAPVANLTTYQSATANNLLTDNASILTLASSSKRRRRRSMDTDASVRALAPSSLWGGSRESLPLSILSANVDAAGVPNTPGIHAGTPRIGAERNSIYSTTGIAPAAAGERNSVYAKQQGDGASVRSGLLGHTRTESVGGGNSNTTPTATSPLASPREAGTETIVRSDKDSESTTTAKEDS
jgi:hypothetical protein